MTDADSDPLAYFIDYVARHQSDAMARGILGMWTVYDRPRDRPDKLVVRMHEIAKGATVPTQQSLEIPAGPEGLAILRTVLEHAGLHCLPRRPEDQPHIVETWI